MRGLPCLFLMILALVWWAAPGQSATGWSRFVHPPTGAAVDVPPGFSVDRKGAEAQGKGRLFRSRDGRALVRIWGEAGGRRSFSQTVDAEIANDQDQGWAVTFRSKTPDWAAWRATRNSTILHARVVSVCEGTQTALLRMTYPALDAPRYDPIADRVSRSLAQDGGCY